MTGVIVSNPAALIASSVELAAAFTRSSVAFVTALFAANTASSVVVAAAFNTSSEVFATALVKKQNPLNTKLN